MKEIDIQLYKFDYIWFFVPVIVASVCLIGLDVFYSFTPSIGIYVRFLGRGLLVCAAVVFLFLAIARALSRKLGTLCGVAAAALIAWGLNCAPFLIGDYIHLAIGYLSYRNVVVTSSNQTPKVISFDWGGTGFAGAGNSSRTLVYDPANALSDQIGIKEASAGIWVRTRHLVGRFYTVEREW